MNYIYVLSKENELLWGILIFFIFSRFILIAFSLHYPRTLKVYHLYIASDMPTSSVLSLFSSYKHRIEYWFVFFLPFESNSSMLFFHFIYFFFIFPMLCLRFSVLSLLFSFFHVILCGYLLKVHWLCLPTVAYSLCCQPSLIFFAICMLAHSIFP